MGESVVERIRLGEDGLTLREHEARYEFALRQLSRGHTIDIACGTGYGSDMISRAHPDMLVAAADIHPPSVAQARSRFPNPGLSFMAANGVTLPFANGVFSNLITFETLEHIPDDRGFLREIVRMLRPDGVCLLSTPDYEYGIRHQRHNPFHVREYTERALVALLQEFFDDVKLYYQGFASRYHEEVRAHAATIQQRKQSLHPAKRILLDYVYKPVKAYIPQSLKSIVIRKQLGLNFPMPEDADIMITDQPVEDRFVLLAVCRQPKCPAT